jgi:hypothetical protein
VLVLDGERTGKRVELRLPDGLYSELMLLPDRWHVRFTPPRSWTSIASEMNGRHWRDVAIELPPGAPDTFLEWTVAAPGHVSGTTSSAGQPVGIPLRLEMMAPGSWAQAQEAAGWPVPREVTASSDDRGRWEVRLPDGTWRVQPAFPQDAGVVSQPEFVIVEVPAGGAARADFELELPEREGQLGAKGPHNVTVYVSAPDAKPLKAAVKIFRAGTEEVVASSGPEVGPSFTLPAGSYRIVGSHPDYLDGSAALTDFVPPPEPKREGVKVSLRDGGTLRVHARDEKDLPVERVRLRLDGPDEKERSKATDASGRATFSGLPPGKFVLDGAAEGSTNERIAWDGGTTLVLTEGESTERRLRVLPAATLTASLVCLEGQALPAQVSARVVPSDGDPKDGLEKPLLDSLIAVEPEGKISVGPLEEGGVRLWVLPKDFDRGTWAPGTEEPAESSKVQIEGTGPMDLGTLQIHCGPRASLELDSNAPPVDLRLGLAQVKGVLLEGYDPVTGEVRQRVPLRPLSLARRQDGLEASGLPEGTVELTFTLCSQAAPEAQGGQEMCAPLEGVRVIPVHWTIRVPAVRGKISRTEVAWPWQGGDSP